MVEELQQLREENARLRAEHGLLSLTGAIAAPWMQRDSIIVGRSRLHPRRITGTALPETEVRCFRAATRVAVELTLTFPQSERPWSSGGRAVLDNSAGRPLHIVEVRQSAATEEGAAGVRIIVEAEAAKDEAFGPYTLELREADGDRTVTLGPVLFPPL